ncbi:MAG: M4 family metallopeptidase, partial [Chloroflexi bacterium]|nr:M4 family metallopeptidase [Chloroflexota bacterium]
MTAKHLLSVRMLSRLFAFGALSLLVMQSAGAAKAWNGSLPSSSTPDLGALATQCVDSAGGSDATHALTGRLSFAQAAPGRALPRFAQSSPADTPESVARSYLSVCGPLFGVQDESRELNVSRETTAEGGRTVLRFQQVSEGVPVIGGELNVQLDSAKNVTALAGELLPDLALDTHPTVQSAAARQVALQSVAKEYQLAADALEATQPELWVYNPALIQPVGGPSMLVWRAEVTTKQLAPIRELVLVSARDGAVVLAFNQIDAAKNRLTYTASNGTSLPGTLVCNESNPTCSGGDTTAQGAHTNVGRTYDFYSTYFGRDSIDGAGMSLVSTVHYGSSYDNAFWNGTQMVFGDYRTFSAATDVVGHELTHGVTQYTSGLYYWYQSGAIDESMSDIFGEFVDQVYGTGSSNPWLMGQDVQPGGAIRSMSNPPQYSQPDKMSSSYYYFGIFDNGGVHVNDGIGNKAAYLMTAGGSFNGRTVSALGLTKVAHIYYEVQTHWLTSGSDYNDLYNDLYAGCLALVGQYSITSSNCDQVRSATLAVEMNKQPFYNVSWDAPVCAAGQTPSYLFNDNLESGSGNWTFGANVSSTRWQYDSPYGPYGHSGNHSLFAYGYPGAISDSYAAMNTSITLPANAYMRFAHAYSFEPPNYDGGVVEYSTNGGSTWSDAGSLFDAGTYRGKIYSGYSNPLANRSAFLAESTGYVSSRLKLSTLAGQSVRFRWRMGTDASLARLGWWVDDVQIYTCSGSATSQPRLFLPFSGKGIATSTSLRIYGQLTQAGAAAVNAPVTLYKWTGSAYASIASTKTDNLGYYHFLGVGSLSSGQWYVVEFWNQAGIAGELWWLDTYYVTTYSAGATAWLGSGEISDIPLVSPCGATVTLPNTFQWKRRNGSYSYLMELFDLSRTVYWASAWTGSDYYVLSSRPSGFTTNYQYGWDTIVNPSAPSL